MDGRAERQLRPHQKHDSAEPDDEPCDARGSQTLAIPHGSLDTSHPERRGRDENRRQSARDPLLGEHDATIAENEHQEAEQGNRTPARDWWKLLAANQYPTCEEGAGKRPSEAAHQRW